MAVQIPAAILQLMTISINAAVNRAILLYERGATEEEIRAHITAMKARDLAATTELDRLRQANQ
jgi:hypothetical protein